MQAGGRLGQADFYHHIELSRSAGWGQAGGRLTLIIIKNFLKEQAECRLGAGWGLAGGRLTFIIIKNIQGVQAGGRLGAG